MKILKKTIDKIGFYKDWQIAFLYRQIILWPVYSEHVLILKNMGLRLMFQYCSDF